MKHTKLIDTYLSRQHMMQLATVHNGRPWCCTVYYIHDHAGNLYWASLPTRRHSQEIAEQSNAAAAIAINFVNGEKVTGLQFEGTAELLEPSPAIQELAELYAKKFKRDGQWVSDFVAGRTNHRLYKLTPQSIMLFDEANFPENPQQQLLGRD